MRQVCAGAVCLILATACGGSPPVQQPVVVAPTPEPAQPEDAEPGAKDFEAGEPLELSGGAALGCEARGSGDWVRVRCVGLSYFGVPAWRVSADDNSAGIHPKITQQLGDVELTWRYREGSALHASFVWFPNIVRLQSEWPKGSPRPRVVARFINVPARSATDSIAAACECTPRLAPDLILGSAGYGCRSPTLGGDGIDAWEPECLRQLEMGCQEFNECLTHEPSGGRPCADDEHPSGLGAFTSCHKQCDETRRCPSGFSCDDAYEHSPTGDPPETRPFACFPTDDAHAEYLQALNSYLERRAPLAR